MSRSLTQGQQIGVVIRPDSSDTLRATSGTKSLVREVPYSRFGLHTRTPITAADAANFAFAIGDFNSDGKPDLYCLKTKNTGTGTLEVHVLLASPPTPGPGPGPGPQPPATLADLSWVNTWMEPTEFPEQGETVVVYFSFVNAGNASSTACTIRLALEGVGYVDIPAGSYAPGAQDTAYLRIPGTLAAGDYRVDAYLDVFNQVSELTEGNNVSTHAFGISASGAVSSAGALEGGLSSTGTS